MPHDDQLLPREIFPGLKHQGSEIFHEGVRAAAFAKPAGGCAGSERTAVPGHIVHQHRDSGSAKGFDGFQIPVHILRHAVMNHQDGAERCAVIRPEAPGLNVAGTGGGRKGEGLLFHLQTPLISLFGVHFVSVPLLYTGKGRLQPVKD